MFKRFGVLLFLFGASCLPLVAGDWKTPAWLDNADPVFVGWSGIHRGQANDKRQSCSKVYPAPEAAKNWTDCKEGQHSQCGGPEDCACDDPHDRLVWHDCKEGSYAVCEDADTCKAGCD